MNAIEFVKDKGLLFAIEVLQNSADDFPEIVVDSDGVSYGIGLVPFVGGYHILRGDLKQVVEAFEIIGLFKNLDHAKIELLACETAMHSQILVKLNVGMGYIDTSRVKQAINLVEQCNDR